MLRRLSSLLAAFGIVAVVGCSDSVAPSDVAGTWDVTSLVFTNVADPSESVDAVDFGIDVTLTLTAGGSITITFIEGGSTDTDTGTYTIDGSDFTMTLDGDTVTGTIDLSGDTMTLTLTSGIEFDFDEDGTDEPARVTIVATRV